MREVSRKIERTRCGVRGTHARARVAKGETAIEVSGETQSESNDEPINMHSQVVIRTHTRRVWAQPCLAADRERHTQARRNRPNPLQNRAAVAAAVQARLQKLKLVSRLKNSTSRSLLHPMLTPRSYKTNETRTRTMRRRRTTKLSRRSRKTYLIKRTYQT